jgi:excinuclease UvrABC nuclease subunit
MRKHDELVEYFFDNPSITIPIERKKNFLITGVGVYTFLDSDHKPIYVGFSNNLNDRINQHFRVSGIMKDMPDAMFIRIHFNKDLDFEQYLIKRDSPRLNERGLIKKTTTLNANHIK